MGGWHISLMGILSLEVKRIFRTHAQKKQDTNHFQSSDWNGFQANLVIEKFVRKKELFSSCRQ